jgi:C-terminal peptidase prc
LKKIFCALTIVLTVFSVHAQQTSIDQGEKFRELLHLLDSYYTDTVNKEKLTDLAITKVLEDLDPHSTYILAKDLKRTDEPLVANFEGIGVTFQLLRDTIMVLEVIPSGPSEKVGIEAGDKIVQINDTTVAGIKIDNEGVIKRLRGPKGTKVKVGILRHSAQDLLTFVITRDKIPIYSIDAAYMADPTTGYIKLLRFSASSMTEFFGAVDKLKAQGMKDLILDLQGNTGGYLMTAIQLCNEFLGDKELIVYTQGAHAKREDYRSDNKGSMKEGKLIVLIDEGSASASEIFSGCMQDLDRGLIIGRRSFGKGLVQKPYSFPDGSVVRLTVAHYYTPSGRCIQRPYDKGKKDYYDEYTKRLKSGELFGTDTTKFINIPNIYYDVDKSTLRPESIKVLDSILVYFSQNPDLTIEIGSHTDSRGSDSYNLKQSQERAQTVVDYLVSKGVSRNRLVAVGYGKTKLINKCGDGVDCTEEEHQQNRRTTFRVLGYANSLSAANEKLDFPDSLTYYTKYHRKVYGGGGVVPEIFVPIDTSLNSTYYQGIRGKGILNSFCLEYVDKNRQHMKELYPTEDAFVKNFHIDDQILEELYKMGDKDSVKRNAKEMERSRPLFVNQVKSLIARDMFDNVAFWRVANEMNDSYKKAVEVMHSDKFDILKPSKKDQKKIDKDRKKKSKEGTATESEK